MTCNGMLLSRVLPGWSSPERARPLIGVLSGEGIGPEVIAATLDVLQAVESSTGHSLQIRHGGRIGKAAELATGKPLTSPVVRFCESIFDEGGAILCGPGSGRFVYDLRAQFDLFCKFTPVRPQPALVDTGVLRPKAVEGVDFVVVRENVGGVYFGEARRNKDAAGRARVTCTFGYDEPCVRRLVETAVRLAQGRRGKVTLVVKLSGVPDISELWCEIFHELTAQTSLDTEILEVDNANYQMLANARSFDVIVAPNMLGDILSDGASVLLGSRGLSYSGNFTPAGAAVYQTGHGAAYDIAGTGTANPVGQILSAAFMLRESFDLGEAASMIERAVHDTLAAGFRTADVAAPGSRILGTREMGLRIAETVAKSTVSAVSVAS